MKPRLIILLLAAVVLAVVFATRPAKTPVSVTDPPDNVRPDNPADNDISKRPLPGEAPAVPPEFSVKVEVDRAGGKSGKNRLRFYVTEKHGYFVETLRILFWYQKAGTEIQPEASPLQFTHHVNDFIAAKETFASFIEVVPAELARVGGDIGVSDNWRAKVVHYHRARTANPVPPWEHPGK